ncbi:MAG: hypothetical protein ACM3SY_18470 [Candidatus Omnitrophota bacterium]
MRGKLIVGILGLSFLFLSHFPYAAIPNEERAALMALYNSTGGDRWIKNEGWKTPPLHKDGFSMPGTEEKWHGIAVERDHVTGIYLDENNLSGNLPSELDNLSEVTDLYLYGNELGGGIPPEWGNLSKLVNLFLHRNHLNETIPKELGNLKNLQYLSLESNQFMGDIPSELGNLKSLIDLYLNNNQLSGHIPKTIGNLRNLTTLILNDNTLTGTIPKELGNLTGLETLFLDNNQLSGEIPKELGNLGNIKYFFLNHNHLSGIIPGNLSALHPKFFNLHRNCKLHTADPALIKWLDKYNPDWGTTQTNCTGVVPTLELIAPQKGAKWVMKNKYLITWSTYGVIRKVSIAYSIDNKASWTMIASSIPNANAYEWTVPEIVSIASHACTVYIRINAVDGTAEGVSASFCLNREERDN